MNVNKQAKPVEAVEDVKPMLGDYPPGYKPGWVHTDDGRPVYSSRFGVLEIGMVPGKGWDQWLYHEIGGGGSLVLGWRRYPKTGQLYVMMLRAERFNLIGDPDIEAPGGFVEDGETKLLAGVRELLEETGLLANPESVPGRPYTGNRAFGGLPREGAGTAVLQFELTDEQVEAVNRSDNLVMLTWGEAVRTTRDGLSAAALARLRAFVDDLS